MHYQHTNDEISWRCTSKNAKFRRCRVRLRTRLVNGYEMIKKTNIKHDHE